jgi:hypothetical protein
MTSRTTKASSGPERTSLGLATRLACARTLAGCTTSPTGVETSFEPHAQSTIESTAIGEHASQDNLEVFMSFAPWV